jgi:hypothetical protein
MVELTVHGQTRAVDIEPEVRLRWADVGLLPIPNADARRCPR